MNSPSQPDSPLILVVDDDRTLRALLRLAMEEEGYRVAEAKNGENCLAEFTRLQPDIVLLDAVMPVMDGFSCCSQLRTLSGAEYTPVLMITVLDDQDSVDQAFEVGATDYVTKPIHWAVLRQRVARLLEASRSLKQVGQVTELLQRQTWRESLFRGIARRLTKTTLAELLNPSVQEIREFLEVDCIAIYHKNPSLTLKASSEGGVSLATSSVKETSWEMNYTKEFEEGRVVAISDIQQQGVPEAVARCLEPLKIRAVLIIPIVSKGEWWGLLEVAHSHSRDWETEIVELLVELVNLMAIAIR